LTETDDKAEEKPARKSASFWHTQLDYAAKREEKWRKSGDDVQCRYMDDRDHYEGGGQFEKRINILWSNTEVQKGALFSNLGNPDVRRAFPLPGNANKIARTAALVIERALTACGNRYDPDVEIENSIDDVLLPGRGVCWINYTPTVSQVPDETGEMVERITYQDVRFEHVEWKSFRHGNCRSWDRDVPWVARELLFTKSDLKKRWPDDAEAIPVNQVVDEEHINAEAKKDGSFKRARVWEIWYKPEGIRVYVAEGYPHELERQEDPYQLENFFPCPRPLYSVKTASSLIPRPEFLQYKDQADELDRINTRLWKLIEKLKYCGVYDGSAEDDDALKDIGTLQDGEFKPYKNFQALKEGGGLAAAFQSRDLAPIAVAIQGLAQRAIELIQSIYEITGISDIMRGASDKEETATAQKIKANFGSGRLKRKQQDVARFVRALYRMKGEIISEHFEREQLVQMTGIPLPLEAERQQAKMQLQQMEQYQQMVQQAQQGGMQPPPPPLTPEQAKELEHIVDASTWEEVSGVLRSDDRRNYNIDIETDITAFDDEETEKQQRIEFMASMTAWLQSAIPAVQANPSLAPLMKELTMFSIGAFKIGRTLEEAFEDAFEQIQNAPPQPNPEAEAAKAEQEMKQQELQAKMQERQADAQLKAKDREQDMAFKQQEHGLKREEMETSLQFKQQELAFKAQELEMKQAAATFDMHLKQDNSRFDQGLRHEDQQIKREDAEFNRQGQAEERAFKQQESQERLEMDKQASAVQGDAATSGEAIKGQIADLAKVMQTAIDQQSQIAESLKAVSQQTVETSEALRAVVGYMRAPKRLKRDDQGRASHIEIGEAPQGELSELMAGLQAGERQLVRDNNNRVEAFA
jgi:hypothetical protein